MVSINRITNYLVVVLCILLIIATPTGAALEEIGSGLIPDLLVSMEGGDQPAYALVVEKRSQQITLFKYDGRYQVVETIKCSTGKARGDKRVSGDQKTPEGAYFFTKVFVDQELAPLYGTRAFPLDYPNFIDRRQGRNGYAIWMHGTNRPLEDRDSNGCIAMVNQDIDRLSAYIALKDTPILIAEEITYKPVAKAVSENSAVRSFLSGWNKALANGTYHEYLSFYDSEYLPTIVWWMKWLEARKPGPLTAGAISTELDYLGIYKHRELYVAIFNQQLAEGDIKTAAGRRKIFISFQSGEPRIVGDAFMETGVADDTAAAYPLIVAAHALRSRQSGTAALANLVDRWVKAWSGKDLSSYGACYSKEFRSKRMDKKKWLEYKDRLNKKYRYINVSANKIKIQRGEDTATIVFLQTYESNVHKTKGIKTLTLKMEDGKWKIFRETFKRK